MTPAVRRSASFARRWSFPIPAISTNGSASRCRSALAIQRRMSPGPSSRFVVVIIVSCIRCTSDLLEETLERIGCLLMWGVLRCVHFFLCDDTRFPRRDVVGGLLRREHRAAADLPMKDRSEFVVGRPVREG